MDWLTRSQFLADLVAETEGGVLVHGDPALRVMGIDYDSRRVEPGEIFVTIPGFRHHGLEFVPEALARGAAAIVTETPIEGAPALVVVPDARRALADLSAAFYGHPSSDLPVVGITGTDGKTSTTHLLSAILEAHGLRSGWLTTINTRIGDDIRPNAVDHTTPEAPIVQRTLAEMRAARLDVALLETSSHGLALERVRGVDFRVGVFTNLSPEHLNFHGSFEAYLAAKRVLFERLPTDGLAVLNADDPSSEAMHAATRARVVSYAMDHPGDVEASDVRLSSRGTSFVLHPEGVPISTRLVGRFNVSNWLAAYAAATYFGATAADMAHAARVRAPVSGRMTQVDRGQPFAVVIDFAHTPQALETALDTLRSLSSGRLLVAFGLAGGRDAANRSVMGALAARKADYVVITTDDPGYEQPLAIAEAIARGARSVGDHYAIELDRRTAMRALFERARPGDTVLLAGKGHEQRMVVGDQRLPWNDACVAAEVLRDLGFATQAVP